MSWKQVHKLWIIRIFYSNKPNFWTWNIILLNGISTLGNPCFPFWVPCLGSVLVQIGEWLWRAPLTVEDPSCPASHPRFPHRLQPSTRGPSRGKLCDQLIIKKNYNPGSTSSKKKSGQFIHSAYYEVTGHRYGLLKVENPLRIPSGIPEMRMTIMSDDLQPAGSPLG